MWALEICILFNLFLGFLVQTTESMTYNFMIDSLTIIKKKLWDTEFGPNKYSFSAWIHSGVGWGERLIPLRGGGENGSVWTIAADLWSIFLGIQNISGTICQATLQHDICPILIWF